jgi:O-antigen ligase
MPRPTLQDRVRSTLSQTAPQIVFVLVIAALIAARAGGIARIVYPIGAVAIGLQLKRRSPAAYVSFVIWLWFLSPLVRRMADYLAGWQEPSYVLLTPYLVTLLSVSSIVDRALRRGPARLPIAGTTMFGLTAMGVMTGVPLGYAMAISPAALESLNFLVPLALGWYVATNYQHLHEIERATVRTFGRAALIAGVYGIYQFSSPPTWDISWMQNIEMTTIGRPEPFSVRVFSTMHSPGILGCFLALALTLWVAQPRMTTLLGAGAVAVTLLLSQVRAAWLAFVIAGLLVLVSLKPVQQLRAALLIVLAAGGMAAFMLTPEIAEQTQTRMETMQQLDEDSSAQARIEGHAVALEFVATHPLGAGIGQGDPGIESFISMRASIIVAALAQFGLVGATLYLLGMGALLIQLWRYYRRAATADGRALAAAGIGLVATSWLGVMTAGPIGMCVWLIAGLAIADRHLARLRAVAMRARAWAA